MAHHLGKHVLAEFYDCDRTKLDDEAFLRRQAVAAARAMGATIVGVHSHRYQPQGVSVVIILAESHLSLHTWPEFDLASIDIFVCNPDTDPQLAKAHLTEVLEAGRIAELEVERGQLDRVAERHVRLPVDPDAGAATSVDTGAAVGR